MNYEAVALYSQVASAALFLAAMIWIWVKFIQPAVLSAQQAQNALLAEAERRRDEAKAAAAKLTSQIEDAKRDAQAIRERVAAQAASEREAMLREAREAGQRAVRSAQGELDRSRAAAREQLREELLEQALELARRQAAERVDAGVNARLVTSFMNNLEHGGRN